VAAIKIESETMGSVWTHSVGIGQIVTTGSIVLLIECMKTEVPIASPADGEVTFLLACGETVEPGTVVAIVSPTET
jgi:acetyl-CoA carboxylase biotin carboxyl carrier protein